MLIEIFFYIGVPVAPAPPRGPMSEAEMDAQWNDLMQYIKDESETTPVTVTPSVNIQPAPTSQPATRPPMSSEALSALLQELEAAMSDVPELLIPSENQQGNRNLSYLFIYLMKNNLAA